MSTDADRAPTAPASLAGGIWAPAQRPLTVGLVLAVTFVAFEALAVATILPVVGRQLGDLRLYGWVFSAFLLASLIGIVLAGTLADRVPLGRPMLAGLALFALGLIIGGTAPDMLVLVVGRAVQGLGAGVVPAVAYVAISRCYAEDVAADGRDTGPVRAVGCHGQALRPVRVRRIRVLRESFPLVLGLQAAADLHLRRHRDRFSLANPSLVRVRYRGRSHRGHRRSAASRSAHLP
jgi:hypothetical protein